MIRYLLVAFTLLLGTVSAMACERCALPGWNRSPASMKSEGSNVQEAKEQKWTAQQQKYADAAQHIFNHLITHMKPVDGMKWPPKFEVVPELGGDKYNAAAWCTRDRDRKVIRVDGKAQPFVVFTMGYLELLEGNENAIAMILGHELGHHVLGHTSVEFEVKPFTRWLMENHRGEADADWFGAQLIHRAGYSVRDGLLAEWRGLERLGANRGAAKAAGGTHPGTTDRGARLLAKLNDPNAALWRKMAAFENGSVFLSVGDYEAAEAMFKKVADEFPECHEAWANLGTARLMLYCRGLSTAAVKSLKLGQFIGPAYYPTAPSTVRSSQVKLWESAVENLKKANTLKPDQAIILANLGLAYLVHPTGSDNERATAVKYLDAAMKAVRDFDVESDEVRLALVVNLGVAQLAVGDADKGKLLLGLAESMANEMYTDRGSKKVVLPSPLAGALMFNKAAAMEQSDKEAAAKLYETYLNQESQSNPWWMVAFERYTELCNDTTIRARPRSDFRHSATRLRKLCLPLPGSNMIHVGQNVDEALALLGKPTLVTNQPASALRRLRFETHGIELICDDDEVFAVIVISPKGPEIVVREAGLSGRKLGELKVGQSRDEVERMLGKSGRALVLDLDCKCDFYADLGVAITYDDDGKVASLVIGYLNNTTIKR